MRARWQASRSNLFCDSSAKHELLGRERGKRTVREATDVKKAKMAGQ
jgi:hypothetical protein